MVQRSPTAAARKAAAQPRPKRSRSPCEAVKAATGNITALVDAGPQPDAAHALQQQPHSKRQRREANSRPSGPVAGAEVANAAGRDAAANACGAARSIDQQLPSASATTEEGSGLSGGKAGSRRRTSGDPRQKSGNATTGRYVWDLGRQLGFMMAASCFSSPQPLHPQCPVISGVRQFPVALRSTMGCLCVCP